MIVTRFAPSPTGPLHLGHALSAFVAHDFAEANGGRFLLRLEDIDRTRCRPEWEAQTLADLSWLGICWEEPILRQSERLPAYRAALERLWDSGMLYPCRCTRGDIRAALAAPQEGSPVQGPDGLVYPGTCRAAPRSGPMPGGALRLDMRIAMGRIGDDAAFTELSQPVPGPTSFSAAALIASVGDVVLARRDMGTSYHLAVVVDDAAQGVTHVVRGRDLFEATAIHVVLQRLLGLPRPLYLHHRLVRDADGRRLAKRHDARALALYRERAASPADVRRIVGLGQVASSTSRPSFTAV